MADDKVGCGVVVGGAASGMMGFEKEWVGLLELGLGLLLNWFD